MKDRDELPLYSVLLIDALLEKSISQTEAGAKMGVSRTMVCNTANGRGSPTVIKLLHLAVGEDKANAIREAWDASRGKRGSALPDPRAHVATEVAEVAKQEPATGSTSYWYCVVEPNDTTRDYTSIDDTVITICGDELKATFTRLFPWRHHRGRCWIGEGKAEGRDLRLLFTPKKNPNDSRGAIVYTRRDEEPERVTYYAGVETRGVDSKSGRIVDSRISYLYSKDELPCRYMPAFAALDLDNTLFEGWSIIEWAKRFLHAPHLQGVAELYSSLLDLRSGHTAIPQKVSHDEFATAAGAAYAQFYEQNSSEAIRRSMAEFAEETIAGSGFYQFSVGLVKTLRKRLIAPVLITGAPQELADELGKVLDISEIHGFKFQDEANLSVGTTKGKAAKVSQIAADTHRVFQFAAGDEESDILMLRRAPARAGTDALLRQNPGLAADPTTYELTSETTAQAFAEWIERTLPDHSRLP